MSRGLIRSYDRAFDELGNPEKPKKYKVKKANK
jgi:hypothetical protein